LKLVIEVDGYSHFLDEVILIDKMKEKVLKEVGYEVIRFADTKLLNDIQNIMAEIEKNIEELERQNVDKSAKSTPSPRQRGTSLLPMYLLKKISFLLKN
jgi:hypothetical protein